MIYKLHPKALAITDLTELHTYIVLISHSTAIKLNRMSFRFPVKSIVFREQDIQVMEDVLVKPPYRNDNCVPTDPKKPEKQCLNHVKNVVSEFHSLYCLTNSFVS